MRDNRRSQLELRWIPRTDETGRTHMESVWIIPTEAVSIDHAA